MQCRAKEEIIRTGGWKQLQLANGNVNSLIKKRVVIVGTGLVGAMQACFLAERRFPIDVYEARGDIRLAEQQTGRSINLTLSTRGMAALRHVGLEDKVKEMAVPVHSRLIHYSNGKTGTQQYSSRGDATEVLWSIERLRLNKLLLDAAESRHGVTIHFHHKLTSLDIDTGVLVFADMNCKERRLVEAQADLIFGCDGAHSVTRGHLLKKARGDLTQRYITHGYLEVHIPPIGREATKTQDARQLAQNYLHIWPRNEFLLLGLPNQDASFTLNLFMPFTTFQDIRSEEGVFQFFEKHFPDVVDMVGVQTLKDASRKQLLPLLSIQCSKYHYGEKAVIMGDAAHAMVPFYGQGVNCGFEDCLVFHELMERHGEHFAEVLPHFSETRVPDAKAMCDLSMYNYKELRALVNSNWFLFRKKVDLLLARVFPWSFSPLYPMVAFSRVPYHEVVEKWRRQNKMVTFALILVGILIVLFVLVLVLSEVC